MTIRKKSLRNAASNFIARKDVRDFIFTSKGMRCYFCGEVATQIDHKISALAFATDATFDYRKMNNYENLFPICEHCNPKKTT